MKEHLSFVAIMTLIGFRGIKWWGCVFPSRSSKCHAEEVMILCRNRLSWLTPYVKVKPSVVAHEKFSAVQRSHFQHVTISFGDRCDELAGSGDRWQRFLHFPRREQQVREYDCQVMNMIIFELMYLAESQEQTGRQVCVKSVDQWSHYQAFVFCTNNSAHF